MGPDLRTPEQKDAEGRALLDALLEREGLFGWAPVVRLILPALAEAVAQATAGGVTAEAAARAGAAVTQALAPTAPQAS